MRTCRHRFLFILAAVSILGSAGALVAQRPNAFSGSYDHAAIRYTTHPVDTAVSRLNGDIEAGRVRLTFDAATGYLASLLAALDVPRDSQMLVFSETSAQATRINPRNPRALFFNDITMVGWVRGTDRLEVVAQDSRQGPIFYTLAQSPTDRPQLTRDDTCLQCHLSWDTLAVPGLMTISTFPMSDDKNAYASGVVVDHRTPLDQRWGGWYVTGRTLPSRDFGNVPVIRPERELSQPAAPAPRLGSVQGVFDTTNSLTLYSDVAALMVFAHQTHMTNLLTRLGWEARLARCCQVSRSPPIGYGRRLTMSWTTCSCWMKRPSRKRWRGPRASRRDFPLGVQRTAQVDRFDNSISSVACSDTLAAT